MPHATFQSATIPQNRLLPGLLGLRGLAALAVVLFHLVHIAKISVPESFIFISSQFGYGVQLFFVLSAFSLMHTTEHVMHRPTWAIEYFIKRFCRIAPLYYFVMAIIILYPLLYSQPLTLDFGTLLLNLTFTFGFAPWEGIVWAGWAVGVEMQFYIILPVLLLTVRTHYATFFLVVISLIVTYAARISLQGHYENTVAQYGYNWAYFSFATNLCFFTLGMYAYRLSHQVDKSSVILRWVIITFAIAVLGTLLLAGLYNGWQGDLILWGIGFAALTLWQSKWPSCWSASILSQYMGERSYSMYLLHPGLIILFKSPIQSLYEALTPTMGAYAYFICAVPVLLVLMVLSEVTYRLIEVPAIRYGKKVNIGLRKADSASRCSCSAGTIRQDT